MSILLGDNFSYSAQKPLDGRLKYDTVASMKAVADATMYDGCMAYCVATDKTYQWKSSNTVDDTLGKWREFSSGGGGAEIDDTATASDKVWSSQKIDTTKLNKVLAEAVKVAGEDVTNIASAITSLAGIARVRTLPKNNFGPGASYNYNSESYGTKGAVKAYHYLWEAGNSFSYPTGVPQWFTYPSYDVNYLLITYRNEEDTFIDEFAYCFYTESSTAKMRMYQRRCTKSESTWTFPEWAQIGGSDEDAYHTTDSAETSIEDTDYFPFQDVSANNKKKSLWSNIKSKLKDYFDTIYDVNKNDIPMYATSSTGASSTAKTASVMRGTFSLVAGAKVSVKFTNTNTASAPTLNVDSTGAMYIECIDSNGTVTTPTTWWGAGDVVTFIYNGTYWIMQPTFATMPNIPVIANKFNKSDLYSTTEKVVGCWTDGKSLYQKTFTVTVPTTSTDGSEVANYYTIGSSIDTVVKLTGSLNSSGAYIPLDKIASATSKNTDTASSHVHANKYVALAVFNNSHATTANRNKLRVTNTNTGYSGLTCYVTIQYTKTTDSANSFKYADENDYSTSEKIVGTWVDGSLIYQKTISFGALPNATTKEVAHGISKLKMYVKAFGLATDGTYTMTFNNSQPAGYTTLESVATAVNYGFQFYFDKTKIYVKTGNDRSTYSAYITLQYTKTS